MRSRCKRQNVRYQRAILVVDRNRCFLERKSRDLRPGTGNKYVKVTHFFYFLFLLFFQLLEFSSKKFDEKFDFTRERNRRRRRGRERENPATILFPEIISIGNFREEYSWSYAFTAGSDVFDPYKSIARNEWKFSWNPSVGSGQTCYLSLWNRFTRACTRHRKRIRARPTRREI